MKRLVYTTIPYMVSALLMLLLSMQHYAVFAFSMKSNKPVKNVSKAPVFTCCDLNTEILSPEGVELARQLEVLSMLKRLESLRVAARHSLTEKIPADIREEIRDIRQDVVEIVEQTRLEVDYVQSALSVDIAVQDELLHAFTAERDRRMNSNYLWSFRTNGALWAVAEGLSIPTYQYPRYSIPSGSIGIIAGLVPSLFSAIAVRQTGGGHYDAEARANMLAPIFDYSTIPEMRFPKSVWNYLNAHPTRGITDSCRREQLIERWSKDRYLRVFEEKDCKTRLDSITGISQKNLTIQLVSDRLAMLRQLSAVVATMNRPLLEIVMVVRGVKSLPEL